MVSYNSHFAMLMDCMACVCFVMSGLQLGNSEAEGDSYMARLSFGNLLTYMSDIWAKRNLRLGSTVTDVRVHTCDFSV